MERILNKTYLLRTNDSFNEQLKQMSEKNNMSTNQFIRELVSNEYLNSLQLSQ